MFLRIPKNSASACGDYLADADIVAARLPLKVACRTLCRCPAIREKRCRDESLNS